MKIQHLIKTIITSALALATIFIAGRPAPAQQRNQFFCGKSKGLAAVMVRYTRGNIPVIRWTDKSSVSKQHCEIVAARFQEFYIQNKLKYITTGTMNGQPVICVANRKSGDCTGLLLTLDKYTDPREALKRLLSQSLTLYMPPKVMFNSDGSLSLFQEPVMPPGTSFFCGMNSGIPATIAHTPQGNFPIITWGSKDFSDIDEDPLSACVRVSGWFEINSKKNRWTYFTTETIKEQPAICVTGHQGGPCARVLFRLKSGSAPLQILNHLRNSTIGLSRNNINK